MPIDHGTPDLPSQSSSDKGPPLALQSGLVPAQGSELVGYSDRGLPPARPALKLAPGALLRAFARRWFSALTLGLLLGGAAGAALWFLRPIHYTSYALLRIAPVPVQLLPSNGGSHTEDPRSYQQTQVALIRSRPIILAAFLSNPEIRHTELLRREPNPEEWLEKELQVGFLEGADIVRISLSGPNPAELPKVINAVKQAYLDKTENAEHKQQLALLNELERISIGSESKIHEKRTSLENLARVLKTSDSTALTLKQKIALEEYAALKKEVAFINSQLRQIQIKVLVQQAKAGAPEDSPLPESMVEDALTKDELIKAAFERVHKIEADWAIIQGTLKEGSRAEADYKRRHAEQLADAKEAHAKLRAERREMVIASLRKRVREETQRHVGQLTEEQAILERQKKSLQEEVDLMARDAERIGTTSFELEMKRKEIEQAEAIIRDLRQQKERLAIEIQGTQKRVTSLYDAEVPQASNFKSRLQMAIAGAVGVFLLVCGLISFLELRTQRIFSSDEVSHELGMRVLGCLPALPGRSRGAKGTKVGNVDTDAVLTESIDSIRAMLLCDDDLRAHRVLMVTSARSGEGKTTLACHLAASIARSGYRTLLIDCDFRKPAIHHLFGIPSQVGLSDILTGQTDIAQAITPSIIDGLYILQAGVPRRETVTLLGKDSFRKTLESLRSQFDFLVVDSCPVLPVADSLMLGKHADSVVLSVRPHISQAPLVAAAYERLTALRILVLGVVVTGENLRSKAYGELYPMLESQPK